ncbi:DUF3073 domain-containing protein [Tessaracoccus defluvii]|uniref:DUF3073 domain-containing protein n=1 Tax=Tessaracoccus defluvii TaxID=1285901 RepID=A0A7H0H6F7_9ACTN|nr:DUF3073 domain-containing protein [Tessaracoccus defluvii]QNP56123.1 DUF3073 domain-containing protein [Tessaracoccus defluvii]
MGRGRAKAKQTKVARDLKYRPVSTDFASLERELRGDGLPDLDDVTDDSAEESDEYGGYADYSQYLDDDEDDERRSS